MYRRLSRPQGRSGRVRKISPPPRFDPRTVQPVASRYTDCVIPAQDEPIKKCIVIFIIVTIITITTSHRVSAIQACSGFINMSLHRFLGRPTFLLPVGMYTYTNSVICEPCILSECAHFHLRCTAMQFKLYTCFVLFWMLHLFWNHILHLLYTSFLYLHINFHLRNLSTVTVIHNFACFIAWRV